MIIAQAIIDLVLLLGLVLLTMEIRAVKSVLTEMLTPKPSVPKSPLGKTVTSMSNAERRAAGLGPPGAEKLRWR